MLFLRFPRDGGVSESNKKTCQRASYNRTTCPIRIAICTKLQIRISTKKQALARSGFYIEKKYGGYIPMSLARLMHKLIKNLYIIAQFGTRDGQINQASYKASIRIWVIPQKVFFFPQIGDSTPLKNY